VVRAQAAAVAKVTVVAAARVVAAANAGNTQAFPTGGRGGSGHARFLLEASQFLLQAN
jgi:hypothetical protein